MHTSNWIITMNNINLYIQYLKDNITPLTLYCTISFFYSKCSEEEKIAKDIFKEMS